MDGYIGQVILFAGNFAPQGWFPCDGRSLQVSQYTALFSILGTMYGGNGQTTFNLPDLRGRVAVGVNGAAVASSGVVPTPANPGQTGGSTQGALTGTVPGSGTLTPANLPPHTHPASFTGQPGPSATVTVAIPAISGDATSLSPANASLAKGADQNGSDSPQVYGSGPTDTALAPFPLTIPGTTASGTVSVGANSGTGAAFSVTSSLNGGHASTIPPYQNLMYIICWEGIYPNRP